jgi:glycosyltransferase 2 family protein
MKLSRVVQFGAGIALAAGGLAIFFKNVDLHKLGHELISVNPLVAIACAALAVASLWFRALRWNIMLPNSHTAHKRGLFPIVAIAFMLNNILPARLGEAARVVLLWKKNGYTAAQSIGSLVLERLLDMLAFSSCFFMPVFLLGSMKATQIPGAGNGTMTLHSFALIFAAVFMCAVLVLALYAGFPSLTRKTGRRLIKFLPQSLHKKLNTLLSEVLSNLNWIFSFKKTILIIMHTYLIMLSYSFIILLLTHTRGFTLLHALFANAFAAMGAAIPLAPGFVGTLHAVLLQGLLLCGLPREQATAVTILYHAIPYCSITLLGLYYFFRGHISLKEIEQKPQDNK